ncbi:MAG: N-formylglutamate amidohydrolase [Rhodobacteraceae bacterium]|nr:N-formylglutamate amidohydrolase [Paracoccaceae bacterium]
MSARREILPGALIENPQADGPFLFVCEHASNHFPEAFGDLGLSDEAQKAHIAWDPGALALARMLSTKLRGPLVHAGMSRLIYDLNRPPQSAAAMAATSETYEIPGNARITAAERLRRTDSIYIPFHTALHQMIARMLAEGRPPVLVTVHSFTPVWYGQPRAVELGLIHDVDPTFANALMSFVGPSTGMDCRMNEPYSAADGVTHTLRLHATPYGLRHVMLEIRNDLLDTETAVATVADGLAQALQRAFDALYQSHSTKAVI